MGQPVSRSLLCIGVRFVRGAAATNFEDIAEAPDGPNGRLTFSPADGTTKPNNFSVYRGFLDRRFGAPHRFLDRSPRKRLAGVHHKQLHEPELPQRQSQRLVASPNPDRLSIKEELADDDQIWMRRALCRVYPFIHRSIVYWSTFANRSSSA